MLTFIKRIHNAALLILMLTATIYNANSQKEAEPTKQKNAHKCTTETLTQEGQIIKTCIDQDTGTVASKQVINSKEKSITITHYDKKGLKSYEIERKNGETIYTTYHREKNIKQVRRRRDGKSIIDIYSLSDNKKIKNSIEQKI